MAVGVVGGDARAVELALHPLWGPDPVRDLFGFVAPPTWSAFGVVASGRTRALGGPTPHPGADQAVLVGLLLSRRGEAASLTWAPPPPRHCRANPPSGGSPTPVDAAWGWPPRPPMPP